MKFIKPIIMILASIAIIALVILSHLQLNEEVVVVDWFSVESGNTPGNIQFGGRFARQDDWVFKTNYSERPGIYKINIDGSGLKMLNTDHARYINVIGDWIYYSNMDDDFSIYKIRTDGTERENINNNISRYLHVVDGWIYYLDSFPFDLETLEVEPDYIQKSSICRISTDGSEYSKVIESNVIDFTISGNWIYYSNWNDGGRLYRASLFGTNKIKVSDNRAVSSLQVYGEWIYHISYRSVDDVHSIYRSHIFNNIDELIVDGVYTSNINVFDGWIYYIDRNDNNNLYKIRTNGWGKTKVNDEDTTSVFFDGNWVYFTDTKGTFKIRPDGTGRRSLQQLN